jgi:helix-turn-helix protein
MTSDLLHRVEVRKLADPVVEQLAQIVRRLLAEQGRAAPSGAMTVERSARYLSVSRRKFYEVLKEDPDLNASSFLIGSRRYWRKDVLDAWMERRAADQSNPSSSGAA